MSALSAGFPARLRAAMDKLGQSYRALAADAGIAVETLRLYLTGAREPQIGTVERLAVALSVDPRWLAYG